MLVALAAYTAPDRSAHHVELLIFGPPLTISRPLPVVIAARLDRHAALVLDRARDGDEDVRVVGELQAGEGLLAAQALIDDYLPRARRASRPLARPLVPEDLLGGPEAEQAGAGSDAEEVPRWAA